MYYIAFYKWEWDYIDKSIRLWTWSKYSHCELVLNKNENICFSSSFRDGWVRQKQINLDSWNWDLFEVDECIMRHLKKIVTEDWKEYDLLWIFLSQFINLWIHDENKWFCSELCSDIMWLKKPHKFSPEKLFKYITSDKYVQQMWWNQRQIIW